MTLPFQMTEKFSKDESCITDADVVTIKKTSINANDGSCYHYHAMVLQKAHIKTEHWCKGYSDTLMSG